MIELDDVRVVYRTTAALAGVTVAVQPGETVHLRGHNGSGKSTLLRLAAGVEVPDGGSVRVCGHDAASARARASRAYVPDTPPLYDYLSARETATLAARLWGVPVPDAVAAVERIGLGHALDALVAELSLGMRKKLGLAVTTLHDPRVVLVDEPFSGLDTDTVETVRTLLRAWRRDGRSVLVTSHDEAPLRGLVDRQVTLAAGRVVEDTAAASAPLR
jgi:ABC-type multidrug transport system ATPase subunit